jgi:hypothetical protein
LGSGADGFAVLRLGIQFFNRPGGAKRRGQSLTLPSAKANAGDVILATTIAAASMSFVLLNMGASPYRPGKALLPKNGAGSAPDNGVLVEWIVREM